MEVMFSKTFATGEHSWDPYTSEVIEEGRQGEAEENRKGPTDEEVQDIEHNDEETNVSLEDIEVENVFSIEKEHNKKKKKSTSNERNRKITVQNKSKVSTAAGIRHQLDRIVDVAESLLFLL